LQRCIYTLRQFKHKSMNNSNLLYYSLWFLTIVKSESVIFRYFPIWLTFFSVFIVWSCGKCNQKLGNSQTPNNQTIISIVPELKSIVCVSSKKLFNHWYIRLNHGWPSTGIRTHNRICKMSSSPSYVPETARLTVCW